MTTNPEQMKQDILDTFGMQQQAISRNYFNSRLPPDKQHRIDKLLNRSGNNEYGLPVIMANSSQNDQNKSIDSAYIVQN